MSEDIFLSEAETQRLTGKQKPGPQRKALEALNIPYIRAGDDSPLVLKSVATRLGGGKAEEDDFFMPRLSPLTEQR